MKLVNGLAVAMALATSTSTALAAEGSDFIYRYKMTYVVDQSAVETPDPDGDGGDGTPTTPPRSCGSFEIGNGFFATGQALDASGDCVFSGPSATFGALGFDYLTAEAFCASTMNGGGRISRIDKVDTFESHSIVGADLGIIRTTFNIPAVSSITCSTKPSPCTNGEFQDGGSCLPKTDLSCGRLKDDANHYLPGGPNVEMATIGECTFQLPQVTIGVDRVSIMAEGQTMEKWVSTLSSGINGFDSFISRYSSSAASGVDYALWKSNSNVPVIPKVSRPYVEYITVSDVGYGVPAVLPSSINPTANGSGSSGDQTTGKITFKFFPLATGDGESQISEIKIFDRDGAEIPVVSTTMKTQFGDVQTSKLTDGLSATFEKFEVNGQLYGYPTAVALVFPSAKEIGSVAFRSTDTAPKFARKFEAYANANDSAPLFHAFMLPYDISEPISAGQWATVANPAFN